MPDFYVEKLFSDEVQSFMDKHRDHSAHELLLKYKNVGGIPISTIVAQIAGRKKAMDKLPTWSRHQRIVYPPSINLEQASSESTALYKAELLRQEIKSAERIVDLTGGLGSDAYAFHTVFHSVDYVEPDKSLLEITKHNLSAMGATNIAYHNTTAEAYLDTITDAHISQCYIDPSRRNNEGSRTLSLEDWQPNVVALQPRIWELTDRLLVKCSPLLDIQEGIRKLNFVKSVHVVSVAGECKEILFNCLKGHASEVEVHAVNLQTSDQPISFTPDMERNAKITFSKPQRYLYEPNASVLKSGAFKIVAAKFDVAKLHPSSHFYTSERLVTDFPGRIFSVELEVKSDRKEILKFFPDERVNVITRNYPLMVQALRKKLKLKEGGDGYLIATTGPEKKHLLICQKLNRL